MSTYCQAGELCYTCGMDAGLDTEEVVLGGGCFWCTEAVFAMLKGVRTVEPGYACSADAAQLMPTDAHAKPPTYEAVSAGGTPYVEVIRVTYAPNHLSFEEILRVFFATHDGTSLNRQGNDVGPQYASVIFCTTPRQQEKAQHYITVLNAGNFVRPIVTRVEPLGAFYVAEDYHQRYYEQHKDAPYCELVIAPKVGKVETSFKHLLK